MAHRAMANLIARLAGLDAGHFTLNEKPERIAELILEMLSASVAS